MNTYTVTFYSNFQYWRIWQNVNNKKEIDLLYSFGKPENFKDNKPEKIKHFDTLEGCWKYIMETTAWMAAHFTASFNIAKQYTSMFNDYQKIDWEFTSWAKNPHTTTKTNGHTTDDVKTAS